MCLTSLGGYGHLLKKIRNVADDSFFVSKNKEIKDSKIRRF